MIVVACGVRAGIRATVHRVGNGVLNNIPLSHKCGIFINFANTACNLCVTVIPTREGMSCPNAIGQREFPVIRYGNGYRITRTTIGIKRNRRRYSLPISGISLFTG